MPKFNSIFKKMFILLFVVLFLSACSGGSDSPTTTTNDNDNKKPDPKDPPIVLPEPTLGEKILVSSLSSNAHSCIIKNDGAVAGSGSLWCWGPNNFGQLGVGTETESELPSQVAIKSATEVLNDWTDVATSLYHSCAIKVDGSLYCWGYNNHGQVSSSSKILPVLKPFRVAPGSNDWIKVAVGTTHSCGIRSADGIKGELYCWGGNNSGQLGNSKSGATALDQLIPTAVLGTVDAPGTAIVDWTDISVGADHSCGIRDDANNKRTIWCFGLQSRVENNGPTNTVAFIAVPTQESSNSVDWSSLSAAETHTCGIHSTSNNISCWGDNSYEQLEVNQTVIKAATNWVQVSAGNKHSCALNSVGEIICWGSNQFGQIGNGEASDIPVKVLNAQTVSITGVDWQSVSAGEFHTCAVKTDNTLYCWGSRESTAIALAGSHSVIPSQEKTLATNWKTVNSGSLSKNNYAIDAQDALFAWGHNKYGLVLGTGSNKNEQVAATIDAGPWLKVSGDTVHACGVKLNDGSLWCWGDNQSLQFGIQLSNKSTPSLIDNGPWIDISVGGAHSCGIKDDNSLWCWGVNNSGEVGVASTLATLKITEVKFPVTTWKSITSGNNQSCAITSVDKVYCWGDNSTGKLGDNSLTNSGFPVAISDASASSWGSVDTGLYHSCGIKLDGSLYCWGNNESGQLAYKDLNNKIPNQEQSNATWKSVSVGGYHTCAIKNSGSLWCWGKNEYGQLGIKPLVDAKGKDILLVNSTMPLLVETEATVWNSVVTGLDHTCAVKADNTVWCWGANTNGQLGNEQAWLAAPVDLIRH